MEKEYLDDKLKKLAADRSEKYEEKHTRLYGSGEWISEAYKREIKRLQPIIDAIDNAPDNRITIEGYLCEKSKDGTYKIGMGEIKRFKWLSMIEIENDPDNSKRSIYYCGDLPLHLGGIEVADNKEHTLMTTLGDNEIGQADGKCTILENAMKYSCHRDANPDKIRQISVQLQLTMLQKLGIKLTDEEQSKMWGYSKEELESQIQQIKQKEQTEYDIAEKEKLGDGKWIEEAYNRELTRLQPIIDSINASPDGKIEINGYTCKKSSRGYSIGTDKYGIGMIEIKPERDIKTDTGITRQKSISYSKDFHLGDISVSNNPDFTQFNTIGLDSIGEKYGKNTILENALNFHYNNPDTDKEKQLKVQQYLIMLKDLGLELTPTENMAMLRGKKQYLEAQLAEVNKELAQKESEQK